MKKIVCLIGIFMLVLSFNAWADNDKTPPGSGINPNQFDGRPGFDNGKAWWKGDGGFGCWNCSRYYVDEVTTQDQDGQAFTDWVGDQKNTVNPGPGFFNVGGGDAHAGAHGWSASDYDTDAKGGTVAIAGGEADANAYDPHLKVFSIDTFGLGSDGLEYGAKSGAFSSMGVNSESSGLALGMFNKHNYADVDLGVEGFVERGTNAHAKSYSAAAGGGEGSSSYYKASNDGKDIDFYKRWCKIGEMEVGALEGSAFAAGGTFVKAEDFVSFDGYGSKAFGITGNMATNDVDNVIGDRFHRTQEVDGSGEIGHVTNANPGTWSNGGGSFSYEGRSAGAGFTTTQGRSEYTYTPNGVNAHSQSSGISFATSN